MKNKIRIIDVSILSSYMGKALSVLVTLFVVGIAASALFSGGGAERNVIRVCVPAGARSGDAAESWEPFRALLAAETRRPVVVSESGGDWPAGFDLYVMPPSDLFEKESRLGVEALFEIAAAPHRSEKAVVIAKSSEDAEDFPPADPGEIAFADPLSVNGFWVQAGALAERGLDVNAAADLRFEGTRRDATRAVFAVLFGGARFGACRIGEISSLAERGAIDPREIQTVMAADALPDLLLCAERRESKYFEKRIGAVSRRLGDRGALSPRGDAARLLAARGIAAIERLPAGRLEQTRRLYERFGSAARRNATVSP
jgi:ABC-type phosphate/phosphonate transport system substrate-binding protein